MKDKTKKSSSKLALTKSQVDSVIHLYSNGQIKEAIGQINALNELYPNVPLLFNLLGACYKALGQLENAEKMFKTAFTLKPDYAEAYFNHGIILKGLGRLKSAVQSYEKAISIIPGYPDAHNNLGNVLKELGMINKAIASYEWAVAYKSDFAEAFNNLGNAQCDLGMHQLAIKNYHKAYSVNPNFLDALFNLGVVNKQLGNEKTALQTFKKIIEFQPLNTKAYRNLSEIKHYNQNDLNAIKKMEMLLTNSSLDNSNLIDLNFALSNAYQDLNDLDKQFKYLEDANMLRKKLLDYSIDNSKQLFSTIKKMFNTLPVAKNKMSSLQEFKPIFIVGMPRSGTSLVEQIIASHNKVHGAGELEFLSQILSQLISDDLSSLTKDNFEFIYEEYISKIANLKISNKVVTDKMPMNFRYIGFILSSFPEAKIVHLKRDARASCWSIYKNYFDSKGIGYSCDQSDLATYYGLYSDLMVFWHELYPNQIYDICYEELTMNQEKETRKLLEYCELDWDENCLSFHSNKRVVKTSSALQVRKKMYQGSSEAWKKYETYLKPLIEGLKSY